MSSKAPSTARQATYEDLLTLPEHVIGEIIDGELIVSPRPAPKHALAATRLTSELSGPFDRGRGGPGGWWILFEPELHLDRQVVVPDLAGWKRDRMPALPQTAWFETAPDWVCEVISPSTGFIDRTRKLRVYGEHEVSWLWFVDPPTRTVEALRREGEQWIVAANQGGDQLARLPPFEAIELELAALWEPMPASSETK